MHLTLEELLVAQGSQHGPLMYKHKLMHKHKLNVQINPRNKGNVKMLTVKRILLAHELNGHSP